MGSTSSLLFPTEGRALAGSSALSLVPPPPALRPFSSSRPPARSSVLFPDVRPLLFLQPLRRLASGEAAPHTLAPLVHGAADGELSLNGKWIPF